MDFVRNWLHFIDRAQLGPFLVGAADTALFKFCTEENVASAAISPELDVWTYERKAKAKEAVYEIQTQWKCARALYMCTLHTHAIHTLHGGGGGVCGPRPS